ncbi:pyridoxamine 5'-phosphate oxidase family protein [Yinghuangia seranimata]|uniref:pyridoxamine 5'-phosphate oxidase family protein n=1 Tax=Yinghuangia seranimata TaxID=408067 RepID=UPI00248CFDD1|nr:pyridoxamine 5'-phosphate oxidase family protein [Yinghuangia seranimata]MDI2129546.1 pyridoxamine 5'-phosphate oxidase family protein [Yinghuangia seranimata]
MTASEPTAADLLASALTTLRSHPLGFLTTGGAAHSTRLVQHLLVEDDATVWVSTSPRTRKSDEIRAVADASYAVEDRTAVAYAVLHAECRLVDDPARRTDLWTDAHAPYFPDGPLGDDFVLLRLRPYRIEIMDFTRAIHPAPYGLHAATLERPREADATDETWHRTA